MSEEGESLRETRWIIQRQDDLLEISRREKEVVSMGFASHVKSCVGNAHIRFTDGTPKFVVPVRNESCPKSRLASKIVMFFILCYCAADCAAVGYEDKIAEIDGVEYFYYEVEAQQKAIPRRAKKSGEAVRDSGSSGVSVKCVLGRHAPRRAVNMPDVRKRLCIPMAFNGKQVVKIEKKACRHLVDVEEIVLPNGISEIGSSAFEECWALKIISIPSTVHTIGGGAFRDCESLKSIALPENVKIAGGEFFKNCKALERFEFPKGVSGLGNNYEPVEYDSIGAEFFFGCSSLKEIVIPPSVVELGYGTFAGCTSLSKIDMPSKLTKIGAEVFNECQNLETIRLPESVDEIGGSAFKGCSGLKTIALPYRITLLKSEVFANCRSLTAISIPENVTEIRFAAFGNCSSLQTVLFSPGIRKIRIADGAFSGCTNLKEIILSRSIADSILDVKLENKFDSEKLRELSGLKITYKE